MDDFLRCGHAFVKHGKSLAIELRLRAEALTANPYARGFLR